MAACASRKPRLELAEKLLLARQSIPSPLDHAYEPDARQSLGEQVSSKLAQALVPVHIVYRTAWLDRERRVFSSVSDIYEPRSSRVAQAQLKAAGAKRHVLSAV